MAGWPWITASISGVKPVGSRASGEAPSTRSAWTALRSPYSARRRSASSLPGSRVATATTGEIGTARGGSEGGEHRRRRGRRRDRGRDVDSAGPARLRGAATDRPRAQTAAPGQRDASIGAGGRRRRLGGAGRPRGRRRPGGSGPASTGEVDGRGLGHQRSHANRLARRVGRRRHRRRITALRLPGFPNRVARRGARSPPAANRGAPDPGPRGAAAARLRRAAAGSRRRPRRPRASTRALAAATRPRAAADAMPAARGRGSSAATSSTSSAVTRSSPRRVGQAQGAGCTQVDHLGHAVGHGSDPLDGRPGRRDGRRASPPASDKSTYAPTSAASSGARRQRTDFAGRATPSTPQRVELRLERGLAHQQDCEIGARAEERIERDEEIAREGLRLVEADEDTATGFGAGQPLAQVVEAQREPLDHESASPRARARARAGGATSSCRCPAGR